MTDAGRGPGNNLQSLRLNFVSVFALAVGSVFDFFKGLVHLMQDCLQVMLNGEILFVSGKFKSILIDVIADVFIFGLVVLWIRL